MPGKQFKTKPVPVCLAVLLGIGAAGVAANAAAPVSASGSDLERGRLPWMSLDQGMAALRERGGRLLLYFRSEEQPSLRLERDVLTHGDTFAALTANYILVRLDPRSKDPVGFVDGQEVLVSTLYRELRLPGVPAIAVVDADMCVLGKLVARPLFEDSAAWLRAHAQGPCEGQPMPASSVFNRLMTMEAPATAEPTIPAEWPPLVEYDPSDPAFCQLARLVCHRLDAELEDCRFPDFSHRDRSEFETSQDFKLRGRDLLEQKFAHVERVFSQIGTQAREVRGIPVNLPAYEPSRGAFELLIPLHGPVVVERSPTSGGGDMLSPGRSPFMGTMPRETCAIGDRLHVRVHVGAEEARAWRGASANGTLVVDLTYRIDSLTESERERRGKSVGRPTNYYPSAGDRIAIVVVPLAVRFRAGDEVLGEVR